MHPLSASEARKLLEAAQGDRLEALYVLAVHTGMRRGELLGLKWPDVDWENREAHSEDSRGPQNPSGKASTG